MTEDKPVAWEVEFGNGEVELWSVKDHSSEPAFGETVTALYSKSPAAVRAAAIAECARVIQSAREEYERENFYTEHDTGAVNPENDAAELVAETYEKCEAIIRALKGGDNEQS